MSDGSLAWQERSFRDAVKQPVQIGTAAYLDRITFRDVWSFRACI